jgi:hypothetical protein
MTPYEELHKKFKLTPQDGESFESFAQRATSKINKLDDDEWRELSEELQTWANSTLKAREAKKELPPLKGYPETTASADAEEPGDADADDTTAEADADSEAEADADAGDSEADAPLSREPDAADADSEVDGDGDSGVDSSPEAETPVRKRVRPKAEPEKAAKKAASKTDARSQPKPEKGKAKTMTTKGKAVAKKAPVASGSRISDDAKIKILAKENPHRPGTKLFKYFAKYKDGMTVGAAKKAGIPTRNIAYLQDQKNAIKLIGAS